MRALLVLILAVSVSACAAVGPTARPRPADPSASPLPPAAKPSKPTATRPEAPTPVPRPQRETPQEPVKPIDLERLGGATESTVVALIGAPDSVREQPPGKVWVYSHGACRVEVYLYPSVDVGNMAVLGTAIAPSSLDDPERERCRRDLARRTAKLR